MGLKTFLQGRVQIYLQTGKGLLNGPLAAGTGQFSFPSFSINKSNPICFQLNEKTILVHEGLKPQDGRRDLCAGEQKLERHQKQCLALFNAVIIILVLIGLIGGLATNPRGPEIFSKYFAKWFHIGHKVSRRVNLAMWAIVVVFWSVQLASFCKCWRVLGSVV